MISKNQVLHIAQLARISLSNKELERYQKDLSKILDFAEKLKEVKIEGIEPTYHALKIFSELREDVPNFLNEKLAQKLIDSAPVKEGRYIKIKSVFQKF